MTILPNQSGEIRLTANLLDTRRRFAPPTKGAGSGRLGGYRGKRWREAERVRLSGEIHLAANLWIRGAGGAVASEKWRGAGGWAGMGEGMARGGTGAVKRGDSPDGEFLDTRRRRSRRQRKWRGAERVRTNAQEKPPPSGGFSCVRKRRRGLPRGRGGRGRGPGRGRRCRGRRG